MAGVRPFEFYLSDDNVSASDVIKGPGGICDRLGWL